MSFCLIFVMLTALAVGPSKGSNREPTVVEELTCVPGDAFLLHIAFIVPPWLGCEIAEDLDPVGTDLPIVSDTQASQHRTLTEGRPSSDSTNTGQSRRPPVSRQSDGSKTTRSGVTNIGEL